VHALEATSTLLQLLGGTVVAQVGVAGVHEKLHAESGVVTDDELGQQLRAGLAAF
jgi:hypothetical protein